MGPVTGMMALLALLYGRGAPGTLGWWPVQGAEVVACPPQCGWVFALGACVVLLCQYL